MKPFLYISPKMRTQRMLIIITPLMCNLSWAHLLSQAPSMYTIQLARNQKGKRLMYRLFRSSELLNAYRHHC